MRKMHTATATVWAVAKATILLSSQILYFALAALASRLQARPPRRLPA
jgi:hypothetical protein